MDSLPLWNGDTKLWCFLYTKYFKLLKREKGRGREREREGEREREIDREREIERERERERERSGTWTITGCYDTCTMRFISKA